MIYFEVDDVLDIHKDQIEEYGGDPSYNIGAMGKITSVLDQLYPKFGFDKYPSVFDKAAALYYLLTKGHCFVDGNKRVGYMTMFSFLYVNGIEMCVDEDGAYSKTIEIAESKCRGIGIDNYILDDISIWIQENIEYI